MNVWIVLCMVAALVAARALWWWFIGRNVPKYPPLVIDDDDPAMTAAMEKARASFDQFRSLHSSGIEDCQVKIRFLSNAGMLEHLWAAVLKITDTGIEVRYLTPPVTHTGKLERIHVHPISDVEDWAAILPDGSIHGGFTQRVMFEEARKQWGDLPKALETQAAKYV